MPCSERVELKYRVAFGFAVAGTGGLMLTFAGMMVYYTVAFPDPLAIRNNDRAPLIRILARDGSMIAERGAAHEYVPLDRLPKVMPAAVVATEDRRFFDHYGVDPIGMLRAMFDELEGRTVRARRLDADATAREEPVPDARADPYAQGRRAWAGAVARSAADEK